MTIEFKPHGSGMVAEIRTPHALDFFAGLRVLAGHIPIRCSPSLIMSVTSAAINIYIGCEAMKALTNWELTTLEIAGWERVDDDMWSFDMLA